MKKVWIETAQCRTAQYRTAQYRICGFAASRAESLWLSVMLLETRGSASGGVAAKRVEV